MINKQEVPQINQAQADNFNTFRHARRLYIGNIPDSINQEYLSEWLYRSLEAAGGLVDSLPNENPIIKCEIDSKGKFAFIEIRTIEETTTLLQLDGIILWHRQLRIRRPTEYEKFPQIYPNYNVKKLNLDLFKTIGIVIIPTVVDDGPNKIFLANLPTQMDELMILDELKLREMGQGLNYQNYGQQQQNKQNNDNEGYHHYE
ncbi:splicing factor u2af large subunit, putative [Ichthyophthirius multifiliis]|uniref:Splicing factor u2af large subunit, putative n=1 Tax=Ichthyophthirius multifiliis TaxID=5932 RepID=G0R5U9_ICHMU|nr:splicing factor u2af large subunit, putative [Ichthyophthirius multifiliis]EGR27170.1 splicing factor u2af large subunit, putative [Ichthyophthirius multifiliis]|eukprot:XP_004024054.1 splicing factor u2af large subunit, putative [Ichthyophthirius multifiliis]